MTSYSGMAARGREASAAKTTGRRKVIAERIEYGEPDRSNVTPLPGHTLPPYRTRPAYLKGSCGHTLRWLASVNVDGPAPRYLTEKLGRRMTCEHPDCEIPPKPLREPREDDCTWITRKDDEDGNPIRCTVRAKWNTDQGAVCTRHRNYLVANGYLDDPGTEITRG